MEEKLLTEKLKEIKMPENMQARIMENCYRELEDKSMNKSTRNMFKRPMVAVAALALCLCVTGVTALAATGKLQGFFTDVKGWNGAVVGTTYEQATDELELTAIVAGEELLVAITMLKPDEFPYRELEVMGLKAYKIVDGAGNVRIKGETTELLEIKEGAVQVGLSLEEIPGGEYKLIVTELVGGAKAEQDLPISGTWECDFVR